VTILEEHVEAAGNQEDVMRKFSLAIALAGLLLVSCGGAAEAPTSTAAPTPAEAPTSTAAPVGELALAEAGPHEVGVQTLTFVDGDRGDKSLVVEIWYPAAVSGGTDPRDAEPDASDAPYPLILYSHGLTANRLGESPLLIHLASYGFVTASVDHMCDLQPTCLVDRPLDILFVLDQLAGYDQGPLEGMIDTDHVGVMGISQGGYTTLQLAGARIDPGPFLDWYAEESAAGRQPLYTLVNYWGMDFLEAWDEVEAYRGQFDILQEGEPWPPITDERIRAALPGVPALSMMFGERGLAAVTIPTMIIAATADEHVSYQEEIVPMYAHLGTEDRYLLSLVDYTHFAHVSPTGESYYKNFSTAFFGTYLKGWENYAAYLTADYVESLDVDDLVWGVYEGE
jgi:predicted dienelactone hydrolase